MNKKRWAYLTDKLQHIRGVGAARAKKLSQAGYSQKTLARAKPETVAKTTGLSQAIAKRLVDAAKNVPKPKKKAVTPKQPEKKSSRSPTKKKARKATKKKAAKKSTKKKPAQKKASAPKRAANKKAKKNTDQRLHLLEQSVKELTSSVHKLDARLKRQRHELHEAQHQLEYLSWDALPRVVHELAWYIRTHLDTWSEEKIFDWLKDHGHEERHIRHALTTVRGA